MKILNYPICLPGLIWFSISIAYLGIRFFQLSYVHWTDRRPVHLQLVRQEPRIEHAQSPCECFTNYVTMFRQSWVRSPNQFFFTENFSNPIDYVYVEHSMHSSRIVSHELAKYVDPANSTRLLEIFHWFHWENFTVPMWTSHCYTINGDLRYFGFSKWPLLCIGCKMSGSWIANTGVFNTPALNFRQFSNHFEFDTNDSSSVNDFQSGRSNFNRFDVHSAWMIQVKWLASESVMKPKIAR